MLLPILYKSIVNKPDSEADGQTGIQYSDEVSEAGTTSSCRTDVFYALCELNSQFASECDMHKDKLSAIKSLQTFINKLMNN